MLNFSRFGQCQTLNFQDFDFASNIESSNLESAKSWTRLNIEF